MSDTGSKQRWWIASQLNRLPFTCWANLVTWALGWRSLREAADTGLCRKDLAANGHCYCGKIRSGSR